MDLGFRQPWGGGAELSKTHGRCREGKLFPWKSFGVAEIEVRASVGDAAVRLLSADQRGGRRGGHGLGPRQA